MAMEYLGLSDINGPLVAVDGVKGVGFEEMVEMKTATGTRLGRIAALEGERAVIQVFAGTSGMTLSGTASRFTGSPMRLALAPEIVGRIFNGAGEPIDGLGPVYAERFEDINGSAINPVSRSYPRNYIRTGISSIDSLITLIRGQKLPIFSGSGMSHNKLAAQIVRQAKLSEDEGANFGVVFCAMGVTKDVAEYFRRSFEESGALSRVTMFLNLSSDPIVERILTPRCALTAAEYLAFEQGMHILVVMTDMTSYAEALREFSSSKGEIPGRKGYPGYLYSDLASLYERAGVIEGREGSVTQIPILTMPNDDITPHPRFDRLYHRRADRAGPLLGPAGRLSAHQCSAQPVPPDEGRHRRRLHPCRSRGRFQPAVRQLRQGKRRAGPGQRHRRRGAWRDR